MAPFHALFLFLLLALSSCAPAKDTPITITFAGGAVGVEEEVIKEQPSPRVAYANCHIFETISKVVD